MSNYIIILYILGCLCFGITDVVWKKPAMVLNTFWLIACRSFITSLLFGILFLLLSHNYIALPNNFFKASIVFLDYRNAFAVCVINYFGLVFYLKSLKYSTVSALVSFSKIGIIIAMTYGYFYLHEQISIQKFVVLIFILIGISVLEFYNFKKNTRWFSKGLCYTFLSRLCWSTWVFFMPIINKMGVIPFSFILELTVFCLSLILFLFSKANLNSELMETKKHRQSLLILILLGFTGVICSNLAIQEFPVVLLAFVRLIEPLIALSLSYFYLKEKLSAIEWFGISAGIIGLLIYAL